MRGQAGPGTLSSGTLIPIGLAAVVIGALLGATWWLSSLFAEQRVELRIINGRLAAIEDSVRANGEQALSTRDFDVWLELVTERNPSLNLPKRLR